MIHEVSEEKDSWGGEQVNRHMAHTTQTHTSDTFFERGGPRGRGTERFSRDADGDSRVIVTVSAAEWTWAEFETFQRMAEVGLKSTSE